MHQRHHIQCEFCDKTISGRHNFKLCIAAIHKGKKSCNCDICDKVFFIKRKINYTYWRNSWKNYPFNYGVCGQNISFKTNWKQHIEVKHKNELIWNNLTRKYWNCFVFQGPCSYFLYQHHCGHQRRRQDLPRIQSR